MQMRSKIRFLIMDVDGTLTDGKIYMGEQGEVMKAFDVRDGCGIKEILPRYGIEPVIITARSSKILQNRCAELGIEQVYQNTRDKIAKIDLILKTYSEKENITYTYANCAYIGDDILDVPCIEMIRKENGVAACPADAARQARDAANLVCTKDGGQGAVRELIEYLVSLD